MMETIDFNGLTIKTQDNLIWLSTQVSGIVPIETNTWIFVTNTIQPGIGTLSIINDVSQWVGKGNITLYIIRLVSEQINLSAIEEAFKTAKAKKDGRAFPRFNGPSRCFYVGSSRNLHQRLKDHLGYGAKSTFGLHLACWASHFPLELEFKCAKYQGGRDSRVYQALEDTLWDELSPMFGRRGAK